MLVAGILRVDGRLGREGLGLIVAGSSSEEVWVFGVGDGRRVEGDFFLRDGLGPLGWECVGFISVSVVRNGS